MNHTEHKVKPEAILRNWWICHEACSSVYFIKGRKHLHGTVYHHHRPYACPDGLNVWTSEIIAMDNTYAETKNTMYTLENPAN